jgi:hypothetical protein
MLSFLQGEILGLRLRWPRILVLLTCLMMTIVIAQQQRAIEAQRDLMGSLYRDSNQLQKMKKGDPAKQRDRIYVTDERILEPAAKAPAAQPAPTPAPPGVVARIQKQL